MHFQADVVRDEQVLDVMNGTITSLKNKNTVSVIFAQADRGFYDLRATFITWGTPHRQGVGSRTAAYT